MNSSDSTHEILKVWIEGEEPNFSLQPAFDDPAVWGLMFVDIARLLGQAYSDKTGRESSDVVNRIRAAFLAELESPTA